MDEMYKTLFEKADSTLGEQREQILHQLAKFPDEVLPMLLNIIQEDSDKIKGELAIQVIGMIGYPENKSAVPTLVIFLGADINDPRYSASAEVLFQLPTDVIVPYFVKLLLSKGETYFGSIDLDNEVWANGIWANAVEGICSTISWHTINDEYALRCCPTVNYLLCQHDPVLEPKSYALLEVIEKIAPKVDYVIPALLQFAQHHQESNLGKRAERILSVFQPETVMSYRFLLDT